MPTSAPWCAGYEWNRRARLHGSTRSCGLYSLQYSEDSQALHSETPADVHYAGGWYTSSTACCLHLQLLTMFLHRGAQASLPQARACDLPASFGMACTAQEDQYRGGSTLSTAFWPHLQQGARAADCGSRRRNVRLMRARPLIGCGFTLLLLGTCTDVIELRRSACWRPTVNTTIASVAVTVLDWQSLVPYNTYLTQCAGNQGDMRVLPQPEHAGMPGSKSASAHAHADSPSRQGVLLGRSAGKVSASSTPHDATPPDMAAT